MTDGILFIASCFWYLVPMGAANIAPVLFRRFFPRLAVPIDRLIGRQVFGPHKTFRGLLVGILFGLIWFWWQQVASVTTDWSSSLELFDYRTTSIWFGAAAGLGALVGDLLRAAVKRRKGIRPGGYFAPWDQIDYLIGGMVFTLPFYQPSLGVAVATLLVGFLLHVFFSTIGFFLGMKHDRF